MSRLRQRARNFVLDGLSALQGIRPAARPDRPFVQVVLLHHVYRSEELAFGRLLDWLQSHYHVIPYSDAVSRIEDGGIDRGYVALTFDDGLKNNVIAARMMHDRGISGCFFVCPAIVGETEPTKVAEFCQRAQMSYKPNEFMTWNDLDQLKHWGHELGSHTMTHANLASLSTRDAVAELSFSYESLASRLGAVKHFAWPFGRLRFVTAQIVREVRKTGYTSCASGIRGSHGVHTGVKPKETPIRRDHLEANWPLRHIRYFLQASTGDPLSPQALWPAEWRAH